MNTITLWDERTICPECHGATIENDGYVTCKVCGLVMDRGVESVASALKVDKVIDTRPTTFEWWFARVHTPIRLKHHRDTTRFLDRRERRWMTMFEHFRPYTNSFNIDGFVFYRALYIADRLLEEFDISPKLSAATGIFMALNECRIVNVRDVLPRNSSICTTDRILRLAKSLKDTFNWRIRYHDVPAMRDIMNTRNSAELKAKRAELKAKRMLDKMKTSDATMGTCPFCKAKHRFDEYKDFFYLMCSVCGRDSRIVDYHFAPDPTIKIRMNTKKLLTKEMRLVLKGLGLKRYQNEK